ncbi:hypothetical protein ABID97_001920 [Variovorax sp. OAS795]|uniref:hypothetical protein n=1 Tax=Variovorax sp. OAS795 TaxID=3034231 RepID=UPI003394EED6
MSMKEFDQYLKASDFFADTMNAHRAATAEVIAAFAVLLKRRGQATDVELNEMFRSLEEGTGRPSVDGSRRILVARIGDSLKARL